MQEQHPNIWTNRFKWLLVALMLGFWYYAPQKPDKSSKVQSYLFEKMTNHTDKHHCNSETTLESPTTLLKKLLNLVF